jgi:hypothetical protein
MLRRRQEIFLFPETAENQMKHYFDDETKAPLAHPKATADYYLHTLIKLYAISVTLAAYGFLFGMAATRLHSGQQ